MRSAAPHSPANQVRCHRCRPFLLPCIAAACLGAVGSTLTLLVVRESLPRMTGAARYAPGMLNSLFHPPPAIETGLRLFDALSSGPVMLCMLRDVYVMVLSRH